MGIRFLCEGCLERLNIKAAQAGKRGKCPHCGESIVIPLKSTIVARRRSETKKEAEVPGEAAGEKTAQFSKTQPFAITDLKAPTNEEGRSPFKLDTFALPPQGDSADSDDSIDLTTDSPPNEPVDSFLLAKPRNPALQPGAADPIDAQPDQVWYVRHPRHSEIGPLRGKQLRDLFDKGEIKVGSYVWRGDWQDWEKVDAIFPGKATPLDDAESASAQRPSKLPGSLPSPKTNPFRWWLPVAIVLGVVTIGGLIYLLIITLS